MKHFDQKPVIKAFLEGRVSGMGENVIPDRIETVISNIFVYKNTAIKLYKNDNDYFNKTIWDMSDTRKRSAFYQDDFRCNQFFSPSVYKRLEGLSWNGKLVSIKGRQRSDDLVIRMERIDTRESLSDALFLGKISEVQAAKVGKDFATKIAHFRPSAGPRYSAVKYFEIRLQDLKNWMELDTRYTTKSEKLRIVNAMEKLFENNMSYFNNYSKTRLKFAPDAHTDNMYFQKGEAVFIDMYSPKKEWQFVPLSFTGLRTACDFYVLAGEGMGRAYLKGFTGHAKTDPISPDIEKFYMLQSLAIKGFYLLILSQSGRSRITEGRRYLRVIDRIIKTIGDEKHVLL